MAAGTISHVAVLQDARNSALLSARVMADIDRSGTMEAPY